MVDLSGGRQSRVDTPQCPHEQSTAGKSKEFMEVPSPPAIAAQLAHAVKLITDLDELLQIMLREPRQSKPWQRQVVALLREAETNIQILRMTIALDRAPAEIEDASDALRAIVRRINASTSGSRADLTTLQAIQLLMQMSDAVGQALNDLTPAFPPDPPPQT